MPSCELGVHRRRRRFRVLQRTRNRPIDVPFKTIGNHDILHLHSPHKVIGIIKFDSGVFEGVVSPCDYGVDPVLRVDAIGAVYGSDTMSEGNGEKANTPPPSSRQESTSDQNDISDVAEMLSNAPRSIIDKLNKVARHRLIKHAFVALPALRPDPVLGVRVYAQKEFYRSLLEILDFSITQSQKPISNFTKPIKIPFSFSLNPPRSWPKLRRFGGLSSVSGSSVSMQEEVEIEEEEEEEDGPTVELCYLDPETNPNSLTEWELDFCSRPILNIRGKKLWELVVCDESLSLQYTKYFPNNVINSITLKDAIEGISEDLGIPLPDKIRYFRSQMQTIITKACNELGIKLVPSKRVCIVLFV
ncbi:uncharacterized protein LOC133805777 [Humulus lupulus]|uniref:uncharacterized protein LOC133805777 n=1 Tax=Humulus lupulus TaxID=3486 RepID=UPI002B405E7D|nr:uncharacterized protein LOC133805777 [Humulus lupulus]